MSKKLDIKLKKRGWEKDEIKKAVKLIQNAKANKHPSSKLMDKLVYYIVLLLLLVINFGISVALIPVAVYFKWQVFYFILIVLGFVLGYSLELVIRSMKHLENNYHTALIFLIPLFSVINLVLVGSNSNLLNRNLGIGFIQNFYLAGIVYGTSLVAPFFYAKMVMGKSNYPR